VRAGGFCAGDLIEEHPVWVARVSELKNTKPTPRVKINIAAPTVTKTRYLVTA